MAVSHGGARASFLGDALKHRTINARRFALTGVALATSCLLSLPAQALGLGRLNVQSVLGETLKAEIDVNSITADEASSLRLRVATPDAYRAAGVEYNAVLTTAQVVLERRADGRPYLRVTSSGAVLEPFVDVIVEATWTSGRLVREYTMLFDPPTTRVAAAPAATTSPVVTPAPVSAPPLAPAAQAAPAVAAAPAPRVASPTSAAPSQRTSDAPRAVAASPATQGNGAVDEYRVRRGDSLSAVAARTQRQGVSLDQMLVSLFRGNPDAFISDNMNRLKAGAVLSVPGADAVKKITAAEAREVIQAQSADFSAYRQRLASGAVVAAEPGAARAATGTVQTKVDDRKQAANTTPDKLKLSQGALKASAPEAKLSKDAERKDAAARLAELARNVDDLKRLQQGTSAASAPAKANMGTPPAPAPTAATVPAVTVPSVVAAVATAPAAPAPAAPAPPTTSSTPPPVVAVAPAVAPTVAPTVAPVLPPVPAVAAVTAASMPNAAAPVAGAAASAPVVVNATPPGAVADEPSFMSALLDNPMLPWGAGGLVALLAGLGLYRMREKMRKRESETSFLESRLQPDSFFGQSGGQRVDTKDAGATGAASSMSYSLSQLDAIGDVDPVAEADVYLAYGRDLQAEEILKEAMRANPDRLAIRTKLLEVYAKLLEVYAKRRDTKGFELLATQLHSTTRGEGEDWAKVQAMGLEIDPQHPLYAPGGSPDAVFGDDGDAVEVLNAPTVPHTAKPTPEAFVPAADVATLDGGLDLDLDLENHGEATMPISVPSITETTQALQTGAAFSLDDAGSYDSTVSLRGKKDAAPAVSDLSLDFDLGDLGDPHPSAAAPQASRQAPSGPSTATHGPDSLMGDEFGEFTMPSAVSLENMDAGDPLARKLELAEEFRQIGDTEGARDLLEEVLAKADGALKAKAQGMLAGLG